MLWKQNELTKNKIHTDTRLLTQRKKNKIKQTITGKLTEKLSMKKQKQDYYRILMIADDDDEVLREV